MNVPPIPHAFERAMRLWGWLHAWRQTGGMGIAKLCGQDLLAYVTLTHDPLSQGDMDAIRIIEQEFHASRMAADERRAKAEEKGRR